MATIGRIFAFNYNTQIFFIIGTSQEQAIDRLVKENGLKRDDLELFCSGESFSISDDTYRSGVVITLETETDDSWTGSESWPGGHEPAISPESCGGLSGTESDLGEHDLPLVWSDSDLGFYDGKKKTS